MRACNVRHESENKKQKKLRRSGINSYPIDIDGFYLLILN